MTKGEAPAARSGRSDGLDLIRGVAVGLVMLRHGLPGAFPGAGVVGVVAFFTLSGYLITGLLVDEYDRTRHIDLRRFYQRRAQRLVPPLLILLLVYSVVTLTLDPLGDRHTLPRDLLVALTWTGNLPHLVPAGATFHLWTLATEEQFYLLWPALLLVCLRRGRPGLAWVTALVLTVVALLATTWWSAGAPEIAYALPTSWAPAFVVGSVTRLHQHRFRTRRRLAVAALILLLTLALVPLRGHPLTYLVAGPGIAVLTATTIQGAASVMRIRAASLRWVVVLGRLSYAAYLWNYPLTLWLRPYPWGPPAAALATLVAAAVTGQLVDRLLPVRRSPTIPQRTSAAGSGRP